MFLASIGNTYFEVTNELLDYLQESFDISEVYNNKLWEDLWFDYSDKRYDYTQQGEAEYFANDIIKYILWNSKQKYYNLIGLIDENGNIYEWLKQPCTLLAEITIGGEPVIQAVVSHGEQKGKLLELTPECFYKEHTFDESDNIYMC